MKEDLDQDRWVMEAENKNRIHALVEEQLERRSEDIRVAERQCMNEEFWSFSEQLATQRVANLCTSSQQLPDQQSNLGIGVPGLLENGV